MPRFLLRRLVVTVLVVFGVTIVVFFLTRVIPGDPVVTMMAAAQVADPDLVAQYRHEYGLDQPLPVQYARWLWKAVQGDLGNSIVSKEKVTVVVGRAFRATSILALTGMITAVLTGVLVGVVGAFVTSEGKHPVLGQVFSLGPLVPIAIPAFSLALFLIIAFAVKIPLFPPVGMHSVRGNSTDLGDLLLHLVLPTLTMAAASSGATARVARATLLEVIREDYIRTARAKGLPERTVLLQHALRNVLIPIVTNTGIMFGSMLSGAVLVESVFAWPGLGRLMVDSISGRDYPVVVGGTLVIAVAYVTVNLLVDITYGFIDPRTRHGR
jgi:ABC-type dipeptide/oligopeptide/nickel transport system permease component